MFSVAAGVGQIPRGHRAGGQGYGDPAASRPGEQSPAAEGHPRRGEEHQAGGGALLLVPYEHGIQEDDAPPLVHLVGTARFFKKKQL